MCKTHQEDFEIQTGLLIQVIRQELMTIKIKNENLDNNGFCRAIRPQCGNQKKGKKGGLLELCQITKKAVEHEGNGDTNCCESPMNGP